MGLGCSGKAEAFAVHRQLLVTPAIPLLSAAWLWEVISKQDIESASSDFNEEQRNYLHKYGNTFLGVFSAYVFGVFFPLFLSPFKVWFCV